MARIVIMNELTERDTLPSVFLARALALRGHEAHLVPQYYLAGLRILKLRPDMVIVNGLRSTRDYIRQVMVPKLLLGSRIVSLYSEQIGKQGDLAHSYNNPEILGSVDAHLCWGKLFAEGITRLGVHPDRVWVVGSHRLDLPMVLGRARNWIREMLSAKHGLQADRPWLLICDNFLVREHSDEEAQLREMLDCSFEKIAHETGHCEVIVRPHPSSSVSQLRQMMARFSKDPSIHVISDDHVAPWVVAASGMVIWKSTSAVEAWAAGVPVYRLETEQPHGDTWFESAVPVLKDPSVLARHLVHDPLTTPSTTINPEQHAVQEQFIKEWYEAIDGYSTARTVDALEHILRQEPVDVARRYPISTIVACFVYEIRFAMIGRLRNRGRHALRQEYVRACLDVLMRAEGDSRLVDRQKVYQ